jgi:hypothetical protein
MAELTYWDHPEYSTCEWDSWPEPVSGLETTIAVVQDVWTTDEYRGVVLALNGIKVGEAQVGPNVAVMSHVETDDGPLIVYKYRGLLLERVGPTQAPIGGQYTVLTRYVGFELPGMVRDPLAITLANLGGLECLPMLVDRLIRLGCEHLIDGAWLRAPLRIAPQS